MWNQITHLAALVPLYLSIKYMYFTLAIFLTITVAFSVIHHADPHDETWLNVDELMSSLLVALSLILYVGRMPVLTPLVILTIVLGVVYDMLVEAMLVVFVMYIVVLFAHEEAIDTPLQISLLLQTGSAGLFLLEGEFAHGWWHVLAFLSLAALIEHVKTQRLI